MTEAEAIAEVARLCAFEVTELSPMPWGWYLTAAGRADQLLPYVNYYLDRPTDGSPCPVGSESHMREVRLHLWTGGRDAPGRVDLAMRGPTRTSVEELLAHAVRELNLRLSFIRLRDTIEDRLVVAQRDTRARLQHVDDFAALVRSARPL